MSTELPNNGLQEKKELYWKIVCILIRIQTWTFISRDWILNKPSVINFTFTEKTVSTLSELSAKCVASHIPFELVEHVYPPVPEQLQLQIAFWSFPDSEDDIRLYSCLANGSADEFQRGEHLFRDRAVKDVLQIGKWFVISVMTYHSIMSFLYWQNFYTILLKFFNLFTVFNFYSNFCIFLKDS